MFKPGDIVVGCNFRHDRDLNGMPGMVLTEVRHRWMFHWATKTFSCEPCCKVVWADDTTDRIALRFLRPHDPTPDDLQWASYKVLQVTMPMPLLPE
jgi:hypothetical protein